MLEMLRGLVWEKVAGEQAVLSHTNPLNISKT